MTYSPPSVTELGSVHTLTLKPGRDNDPKNDQCKKSVGKCLGIGDGHSNESGWS